MFNPASPYHYNDPRAAYFSSSSTSYSLPSDTINGSYFVHQHSSSSTHQHTLSCSVPDPTSTHFFSTSPTSNTTSSDLHYQPVRRVFSTGDIQGAPTMDNFGQEAVAAGARVGRYTAEERMKRIEKYRSKRNQRNFQKKITYACRKTLADSRPRVRGRFARNGETEGEAEGEADVSETSYESYNHTGRHAYENSHGSYSCLEKCASYNSCDDGGSDDDWWRQLQAALSPINGEEECRYNDDSWASTESVFSMNLLS